MTKDEALERARSLLTATLAASQQGKNPYETCNKHDGRRLSEHIGDFLREQQNGYDPVPEADS